MTWLVTGVAGFLGAATARALLDRGETVVGVDNLDPYTDPHLKLARLERLRDPRFTFTTLDIADEGRTTEVVADVRPRRILHYAAQPGVRHALRTPVPHARTNLMGTVHVLEAARLTDVEHVVYASSSSVYGETSKLPFSVHDPADHPVSLYAATKRADELLAHSYSHIHGLATTGLRFFTVYGPWGRPDMAYYAWARAILAGEPVRIFGDGSAERDFTYVDDVVEAVLAVADRPAAPDPDWTPDAPDPASSAAPFRLYNVGRGQQHRVTEVIDLLEAALGRAANRVHEAGKPGDVPRTHAEVHDLEDAVGVRPRVELAEGIARFARWLLDHPEHA
jgi:UDP-glucuronate 4-epimerase